MTCEEIHSGYELSVLGTLEAGGRAGIEAALEEHLARGCPACAAAVAQARALAVHLGLAVPADEPPACLRGNLLAAVSAQVWKRWKAPPQPPLATVRAKEGQWVQTAVDGVTVKRLFVDAAGDRVTMLVRMAPGASYPRHRHAGPEECYVLEGDLRLQPEPAPGAGRLSASSQALVPTDLVMRAGDYQRSEPSSIHGVQSTENGCLLFIVSSLHDEILT